MVTRRRFLELAAAGGGLALLWPRRARAIGEGAKVQIGQIVLGTNWNPRPTALKRLAWEVDKRTSIDIKGDPAEVRLSDQDLYKRPFLYLAVTTVTLILGATSRCDQALYHALFCWSLWNLLSPE